MKILVLAENYTTPDNVVSLHYIHTRNLKYIESGINVNVLSFSTKESYKLDDIKVYSIEDFDENEIKKYDIVISHAPNIRNHMKFINKHKKQINKLIYFFHGHEVLNTSKIYPKPFSYVRTSKPKIAIEKTYNIYKLKYWKYITPKMSKNTSFVFVSEWMLNMFLSETNLRLDQIPNYRIIENAGGEIFFSKSYNDSKSKEYDVVSIRNNFDGSKYCIDLIVNNAVDNPNLKYLVIGKGKYFEYNSIPQNMTVINENLSHLEIINYLNKSRSALLPTRLDSQGVMACEIATFGIPLITSDIPICKEMLSEFENVTYIPNNKSAVDMSNIIEFLERKKPYKKNMRFSSDNTVMQEIEFFKEVVNNGK